MRPPALIRIEAGRYVTQAPGRAMLPTLSFYLKAFSIVYKGSRVARAGLYDEARWRADSDGILKALESVGCRMELEGFENMEMLSGPAVFIGNHMSTLETFALPSLIVPFQPVTFVVKESLATFPIFGHIMRAVHPITVTRKNPRQDLKDVLEKGAEKLSSGTSIIIFPQTTRTQVFDPSEFNSIGIKLAKRASVPVIPLALKTDAWGIGWLLKDFGRIRPEIKVYFKFGEPFMIEGNGKQEHERVVAFISEHLALWGKAR